MPKKQVEAYVLDRELDLYDHVVDVEFVERLRGMVAFTNIPDLIETDARRRRPGARPPLGLSPRRRLGPAPPKPSGAGVAELAVAGRPWRAAAEAGEEPDQLVGGADEDRSVPDRPRGIRRVQAVAAR